MGAARCIPCSCRILQNFHQIRIRTRVEVRILQEGGQRGHLARIVDRHELLDDLLGHTKQVVRYPDQVTVTELQLHLAKRASSREFIAHRAHLPERGEIVVVGR